MSVHVLSVVGSPHGSGSTATATQAVLAGAVAAGARTESLDLSSEDLDAVVDRVDKADGVAFASPVYRAAHTALLASLLEANPARSGRGDPRAARRQGSPGAAHRRELPPLSGHRAVARTVGVFLRGPNPLTWAVFHACLVHPRPTHSIES